LNDSDLMKMLGGFDVSNYLRALIAVVKLHGVEPIEREYVEARAAMLGVKTAALWEEEITEFPPLTEDVGVVTRRVIVRDCIMLGCIDGEFSDKEREWVHRIAVWLDVSVEACDNIEDWLHRYYALMEEQEALLSGFDPPIKELPPEE